MQLDVTQQCFCGFIYTVGRVQYLEQRIIESNFYTVIEPNINFITSVLKNIRKQHEL